MDHQPDAVTFHRQVFSDAGAVCSYPRLHAYRGGTTERAVIYTDIACNVPAENPCIGDIGGRVTVYLKPEERYDLWLEDALGNRIGGLILVGRSVVPRDDELPETPEAAPAPVAEETTPPHDALQDALARMEAAREAVSTKADDVPAEPERPPEAIADLFHADRPYVEQAQALWRRYNELTSLVMMGRATPDQIAKQSRLQGELDWIKRHAFEAA